MKKRILLLFILYFSIFCSYSQTTLFFQGFENTTTTCSENWGYTGGVRNNETAKTGSFSARVGRSAESNTITFNTINTTGLTNLQLQISHSVRGGSGPGMDTREGALFLVSLNGGAYTIISGVGGTGDYNYPWSATTGGITNTCPSTYTTPNPLLYNVPAGTTSIAIRVISVGRNSSTCAAFATAMSGTTAYNFDRTDEGFFIDDVRLVTTSTVTNVTWNGSVSTDWFCQGNWTPAVVPTSAINATFSTDNAVSQRNIVLVTGPVAECNNLNIIGGAANDFSIKGENGATKTLRVFGNLTLNGEDGLDFSDGTTGTPDGTIELRGNWDNQIGESHFKQGESTFILNGTGNQTININSGPEIFYNFRVNKTSGSVILNDDVEVCGNSADPLADRAGVFTLTTGNVLTGTNYIYVTNPSVGAISGGSAASFVDGNLRRQTNTSALYDFPTGEGARYMRSGIRPSNTGINVIEVDAQNTGYGIYSPLESTLNNVSQLRWWDVSRISGSTPVAVRLYWLGTPASEGITNTADLVVAHYSNRDHTGATNTLQWWNRGRNVANSSGLVNDGFVEASETVTTFSPFTFSSLTPLNPLPVELVSFEVTCENNELNVKWITASEVNNDHFEIEGSTNGINYKSLATIDGAGNSNSYVHYSKNMMNIYRNTYFRLVQYDYNGEKKVYDPVYAFCEAKNELKLVQDFNHLQVLWPVSEHEIQWMISDLSGKIMLTGASNGNSIIELSGVSTGIYILQGKDAVTGELYVKKFLKL